MSRYVIKYAAEIGKQIRDANKTLTLVVTADDVINAKKANSKECAISRAVKRLPGVTRGFVFRSVAFIEYPTQIVRYALPDSLQKEIVSFDRAHIFAPGAYHLAAVSPMKRTGKRREYAKRARQSDRAQRQIKAGTFKPLSTRRADTTGAIDKITAGERGDLGKLDNFRKELDRVLTHAKATRVTSKPTRHNGHRTTGIRGLDEPSE